VILENRAFDSLLGWLNRENPDIDGLTGSEFNYANASDPNSEKIYVNDYQPYRIPQDTAHHVAAMSEDIYGQWPLVYPLPEVAPMNGFASSMVNQGGNPEHVMGAFAPETIPITATLAQEFAVFDRWFCSVSGPTQPNRFFAHAASSDGMANNENRRLALGLSVRMIYQNLEEEGYSWINYFAETPTLLLSRWARRPSNWRKFRHLTAFKRDAML